MKIYIQNVTGSEKVEAMLDKDSGVIEFPNGNISHILFEKQAGKVIEAYKNDYHCKLLGKYKEPEAKKTEEKEASSIKQSEARPEKKVKRK